MSRHEPGTTRRVRERTQPEPAEYGSEFAPVPVGDPAVATSAPEAGVSAPPPVTELPGEHGTLRQADRPPSRRERRAGGRRGTELRYAAT